MDYLIIGAGPAGLQLGYFLQKNNRDYLILERASAPGAFFRKFPRHNQLISINKVYTGFDDPEINARWDWNSLICDDSKLLFKNYSKKYFPHRKDMVKYLAAFAYTYNLSIFFNSRVNKISKENGIFSVRVSNGKVFKSRRLIIATGVSQPFLPDIPGINHVECYTNFSTSKKRFQNKRVLIIGKGNSAFETADYLIDTAALIHLVSPTPLRFAWRTHYVGNLRAVNNNLLDTYQLKSQNAIINANITEIEKLNNKYRVTFSYNMANSEVEMLEYDYVIACTGFKFDGSIFATDCMPELAISDRFPKLTSSYESVNIKDLYFAGTLMQQRDFKKEQSGFIHGFRFNLRFLANLFESKYHKNDLTCLSLPIKPYELTRAVLKRMNKTGSLWQQTSYLGDLIVVHRDIKICFYYQSMPVDFIKDSVMNDINNYFIITLEFGQERIDQFPDIFQIERVHKHDAASAHLSTFIHPVIRHYYQNKLISEHHVIEDFEAVWHEPEHIDPLFHYFQSSLNQIYNYKVWA